MDRSTELYYFRRRSDNRLFSTLKGLMILCLIFAALPVLFVLFEFAYGFALSLVVLAAFAVMVLTLFLILLNPHFKAFLGAMNSLETMAALRERLNEIMKIALPIILTVSFLLLSASLLLIIKRAQKCERAGRLAGVITLAGITVLWAVLFYALPK